MWQYDEDTCSKPKRRIARPCLILTIPLEHPLAKPTSLHTAYNELSCGNTDTVGTSTTVISGDLLGHTLLTCNLPANEFIYPKFFSFLCI